MWQGYCKIRLAYSQRAYGGVATKPRDLTMKVGHIAFVSLGLALGFVIQPYLMAAKPPISGLSLISPGLGALVGLQLANLVFRDPRRVACPECRGVVEPGARKCKNCGSSLVAPPNVAQSSQETTGDNVRECTACGSRVPLRILSSDGRCQRCYRPFWAS